MRHWLKLNSCENTHFLDSYSYRSSSVHCEVQESLFGFAGLSYFNKNSWFVLSWTQFPTCISPFTNMKNAIIWKPVRLQNKSDSMAHFLCVMFYDSVILSIRRYCCGKFPKPLDFTVFSSCQLQEEIPEGRKSAAGSKDFMFHRIRFCFSKQNIWSLLVRKTTFPL